MLKLYEITKPNDNSRINTKEIFQGKVVIITIYMSIYDIYKLLKSTDKFIPIINILLIYLYKILRYMNKLIIKSFYSINASS